MYSFVILRWRAIISDTGAVEFQGLMGERPGCELVARQRSSSLRGETGDIFDLRENYDADKSISPCWQNRIVDVAGDLLETFKAMVMTEAPSSSISRSAAVRPSLLF